MHKDLHGSARSRCICPATTGSNPEIILEGVDTQGGGHPHGAREEERITGESDSESWHTYAERRKPDLKNIHAFIPRPR